jgi:hypothetical protein
VHGRENHSGAPPRHQAKLSFTNSKYSFVNLQIKAETIVQLRIFGPLVLVFSAGRFGGRFSRDAHRPRRCGGSGSGTIPARAAFWRLVEAGGFWWNLGHMAHALVGKKIKYRYEGGWEYHVHYESETKVSYSGEEA